MAFYSAGVEYGIHCLLFLVDDLGDLLEVATLDSEADAKAWCDEVFKTAATDVAGG